MAHVFIGLGTNLGDREEQLRVARAHVGQVLSQMRSSWIYETEPWGVTGQPRFLNLVVEGETILTPRELLGALQKIENDMGRVREMRYGPRIIDLDLLLYDDIVMNNDDLEIPHPRIQERRFVLVSLAELAPEIVHPRLKRSIRELLEGLPDTGGERVYAKELE